MNSVEAVQLERPDERRQEDRQTVLYVRFYSPVPGTIVDLTEVGMCLETVAELDQESEYVFRIRHGSLLFSIRGDVRWSKLRSTLASSTGTTLELFRSGIQFHEPLPDETLGFLTGDSFSD